MDTRLHRYSIARFSVYVAVLAGTLAVGSAGGWTDTRSSNLLYVSAFSLVVVATATAALRRWRTGSVFLYAQLLVDLAISTILCAFTGRGSSPLLILYFPTIASAAYLRGLRGSLVAAGLATAMVVALTVVGRSYSGPDARLVLYYEVMFRVFAFFLIAVLTGQLAESAERTGLELVEARRTSELLASEHQLVLDTVRAGVITVGHDRKIVACNPAARELLGDVAGRSIREVLPGITNAAATDLAWEEVRPDGQRWICSAAEMGTEGSVVVVEDITELERMRERHLRDERLVGIGRIAQSVAHEIRNPLASLSGALQIVAEEHPSRVVNIALSEAARLNRMVEDFLTSARPPSLERAPHDLLAVAQAVGEAFEADPRFRGSVHLDVSGAPTVAWVDADRMRQVIWNLVINAAQAMPRGGKVTIEVGAARSARGPGARLRVIDTGPGIPPVDRGKIFDPFFTTRSGGSGLGLAVVDQIVRGHGGEIRPYWPDGGGTEFRIWLPKEVTGGR